MTRLARFAVLFASATACAAGAGDPDRPTSTIADDGSAGTNGSGTTGGADAGGSADDDPMSCVPGQQIACPCPGGAEGAQACNAAGTGYEPCECPGTDESGELTTSTTTMGDTDIPTTTGFPEQCAADVSCDECAACSLDGPCLEQYSKCMSDPTCAQSANCVLECGFTQACAAKCDSAGIGGSALYNDLVSCVVMSCPQCL